MKRRLRAAASVVQVVSGFSRTVLVRLKADATNVVAYRATWMKSVFVFMSSLADQLHERAIELVCMRRVQAVRPVLYDDQPASLDQLVGARR